MDNYDYYKILGIEYDAGAEDVKDAYRRMALKYHPDRNNSNPKLLDKMGRINEAYTVLSDKEKRLDYDSMRRDYGEFAYYEFKETHSGKDIFYKSDIAGVFEEIVQSFGLRGFDKIFQNRTWIISSDETFHTKRVHSRGNIIFDKQVLFVVFRKLCKHFFNRIVDLVFPPGGVDLQDTILVPAKLAKVVGPLSYDYKYGKRKILIEIASGIRTGQRLSFSGLGKKRKNNGAGGDLYLKIKLGKSFLSKIKNFVCAK